MINFPTTLDGLYINGQWSAGREHLRVINPATEALLTTVNGGDESAVDLAVSAATEAFKSWSKTSGAERGAILRNIANGVRNGRDHLMQLQSSNNGKPQFEASIDVDDVIATFEYYANSPKVSMRTRTAMCRCPATTSVRVCGVSRVVWSG